MTPHHPPVHDVHGAAGGPSVVDIPRASEHWASTFFGELYGKLYSTHLLPVGRSRDEAAFALKQMATASGLLLDLAAGFGRHARLVARRRAVVALDLNPRYLRSARAGLGATTAARLHAAAADMRLLPFANASLGGVMMLFNSFGYFTPAEEDAPADEGDIRQREVYRLPQIFYQRGLVGDNFGVYDEGITRPAGDAAALPVGPAAPGDPNLGVLREVHRVTRPGGLFLLEAPNRTPLVRAVREAPRRHLATRSYSVEEEFRFDDDRNLLHNRTRFTSGHQAEVAGYTLRLYNRAELAAALRATGFTIRTTYGDYYGTPFDARQSEMILILAARR